MTLTATAASGSTFNGWGGACSGTATTCTVTLSDSASVTAEFIQTVYILSVGVTNNGGGYVTGPSGINCGATCSAGILAGTSVTLTAWANPGFVFWKWAGDCTGSTSPCSFTMDANKSVTGYFAEGNALCGSDPQIKHSNGLGQSFFDCTPLGTPGNASTYTQTMAVEAAQAWNSSATVSVATCLGSGASVVVATDATNNEAAAWAYTGTAAGYVHLNATGTEPICPATYDFSWQ